jgi:putative membrane protein
MRNRLLLFLKGAAMGLAEVIPGVSGGTLAFITGIYEELLDTIKNILGPELFKAFREGGIKAVWEKANGPFLAVLLPGMAFGLIMGVFIVTKLLESFPQLLWAFFFGLIVASVWYIGKRVGKWRTPEVIGLIAAAALAFYITIAAPAQGTTSLWFILICGMIAISALILPGISGSFILLLMGMYTVIIPAVKTALTTFDATSLTILIVFAIGALIGLATFSRVLSWAFKHQRSLTMAILTGFMIGSLNKIWPWRNVLEYRTNSSGEQVPFLEKSVLPATYDGEPMVLGVIVLMILGFLVVWLLDRTPLEEQ